MEIVVALIGTLGALLIAAIGLYGASRLGIGVNQAKLTQTLTEIVEAQEKKMAQMEEYILELGKINESLKIRIEQLETLKIALEALTVAQSVKLKELGNLS